MTLLKEERSRAPRVALLGAVLVVLVLVLIWPSSASGEGRLHDDDDDGARDESIVPDRLTIVTGGRGPVTVMCDTVNHNLVYVYQDAATRSAAGIAVVPGGC